MARFPASAAAWVAVVALLAAGPAPAQDSPLTVGAVYVGRRTITVTTAP